MTHAGQPGSESLLRDTERTCAVAQRTKQVIFASQGVLVDRKLCRKRTRALAIFFAAFVLLGVTPLVWWTFDTVIAGEHPGELSSQIALWFATLCPALIAAVLVAGWLRDEK